MKIHPTTIHNEEGFVLVTGLLILLVLTLIGITATRNTTIELQIAGNDRIHKETFYAAEAGAILGSEILEQNFNCAVGFGQDATSAGTATNEPAGTGHALINNIIRVYDQGNGIAIWRNPDPADRNPLIPANIVGDINFADAIYPATNIAAGEDVGYLYMGGFTEMLPGGALQMAAGYEGKGKGAAAGGVAKIIDIYSQYRGAMASESIVLFGWRHLIGSEGACIYY